MQNRIKLWIFIAITAIFAGFSIYNNLSLNRHALIYQDYMDQYSRVLNFEERLLNTGEWLTTETEWRKTESKARDMMYYADQHYQTACRLGYYFFFAALAFFPLIIILLHKTPFFYTALTTGVIIGALLCLHVGVTTPMLEISALKSNLTVPVEFEVPIINYPVSWEKTFSGEMYFYYQNKSILDVIKILWQSGNKLVSIAILFFSIGVPTIKMLLSLLILFKRNIQKSKVLTYIAGNIGKWSMADVFVAATFLAFLSFNNMNTGIETRSNTLPGLYFFLSYCIVSIFSSHLVKFAISKGKA
ncbi:MAG: paraquat-inducible protein A [Bacteroidetes bacterium]|nr:paraquat-inducible protein A [Bacteroidota bacterium]MBU1718071.1 paraquat-inducible protein A [Bacteroidota bacterium]